MNGWERGKFKSMAKPLAKKWGHRSLPMAHEVTGISLKNSLSRGVGLQNPATELEG
jgi:hypothetical protein